MPITSVSGVSLTNLGPLTTTFTPPPSCLQSNGMMMYAEPTDLLPVGYISCDWDMESCLPSQSKRTTTDTEETPYTQVVTYFSPGIVCPADWKTVGTAALPTTGQHFYPRGPGRVHTARTYRHLRLPTEPACVCECENSWRNRCAMLPEVSSTWDLRTW